MKKAIILGREGSGKTKMFKKLSIKHIVKDEKIDRTKGFNFESMDLGKDSRLGLWDLGGSESVK